MGTTIQEERTITAEDARIRHLHGLIASGRYDLLSLDVFDTVVWRMVPLPHDVHFLVGHRLIAEGAVNPGASAESFLRERVSAEERARRRTTSAEVTLAEIYAEFPVGYLRGIPPNRVAEIEVETERTVVRPNEEMLGLIDEARRRGLRIAFVSDTYLSAGQVTELTGLCADFVIVSSEHRVSKYQGLHRVLIERSRVSPERILHVGDNHAADIVGPQAFGIDRYWYRQAPESFGELLTAELPTTLSQRSGYFTAHDGGLHYLRRRAATLASDPYERWGAGVLGPVATGFADWVVRRCVDEKITDALCLMREGRLLKSVLVEATGLLRSHEFFISRYVARKSSIFEANEEELRGFVYRPTPRRRSRILEQLGLNGDHPWTGATDEVLPPDETAKLIRRIAGESKLRRQVLQSSARTRAGLLAHLRSVVDPGPARRLAVVDLGYRGTIQECLERILIHEGLGARTHGFYLVTNGEVGSTQATGARAEGWLAENGQPISIAQSFVRSPETFEQSLMAECGTTLGYEPDGTPILDVVRVPAEQAAQIASIQGGVRRFARLWSDHRQKHPVGDTTRLHAHYRAICLRAVARPQESDLELFESWVHDENFGSGRARRLIEVRDLDPWEETHLSAHQIASLPPSRVYWPFGFARRLSPTLGKAVASIYLRAVEPEAFQSSEPARPLVAYWDTGRGFHAGESEVVQYTLNDRGTVWVRLCLDTGATCPRAFGFTIGLPGEVLRLTGVRVVQPEANGERELLRRSHGDLEKIGYERLHENLYLVREDPAVLVARFDAETRPTGRMDVDLFFGLVTGG